MDAISHHHIVYTFQLCSSPFSAPRHRVVEYYLERCQSSFSLLDKFDVIGRTSEFSRLYGIEFENVANRGSQYKVESMMLRLAKPANYIAVSPSVQQRARSEVRGQRSRGFHYL